MRGRARSSDLGFPRLAFRIAASASACYVSLLILLCRVVSAKAFNLEPRIALAKFGKHETYFGLSVSAHQVLSSESIESVLLVGAPLDTYGQSNPGGNPSRATGVLYKCPFTSRTRDCVKVEDVPSARDRRSLAEAAGQWLGVTVNSQGPGKTFVIS